MSPPVVVIQCNPQFQEAQQMVSQAFIGAEASSQRFSVPSEGVKQFLSPHFSLHSPDYSKDNQLFISNLFSSLELNYLSQAPNSSVLRPARWFFQPVLPFVVFISTFTGC